jgi:hypothetical protein
MPTTDFHVKIQLMGRQSLTRVRIRIEVNSCILIRIETSADPQHWFLIT